jgi:hypothetical protein
MRLRRVTAMLFTIVATGGLALGQATRDVTRPVGVSSVSPDAIEAGSGPAEVTLQGWGFAARAEVRIRPQGEKGGGLDYPGRVDSPERVRVVVPADLTSKPGRLELRVKNPDGVQSEWTMVEVRAASAPGSTGANNPAIDYLSPSEVAVRSRNARVAIHGRDLVDGSTVLLRSGSATSEVRANLVGGNLVFTLPAEQVAAPRIVIVQVRSPNGLISETARLTVVEAPTAPAGNAPPSEADPFIAQVDPQRVDASNPRDISVELLGRNIDRDRAIVVVRPEGASTEGGRVLVSRRETAPNGTVLTLGLLPRNVPSAGFYEVQVINADGRRSNWARFEVSYGGETPGGGAAEAAVRAQIPAVVTLTAANAAVPVELTVRNPGRAPVRVGDFAAVLANGERIPVPGSLEVRAGAEQSQRLEVPLPLATAAGARRGEEVRLALTYAVSPASARTPVNQGRYPETGFATVTVRNDVALSRIGREFVEADAPGAPSGWRFFKTENEANEGQGRVADFFLFAEPFRAGGREITEELWNFRPDDADPARRNLSYLTLRSSEITSRDLRNRELGTRLGYVRTEPAPGLVPLYRWARTAGNRAANHFLTIERDPSKLPPRLREGEWRMESAPVGYVIPRQQ